jgi:hypothetical protein
MQSPHLGISKPRGWFINTKSLLLMWFCLLLATLWFFVTTLGCVCLHIWWGNYCHNRLLGIHGWIRGAVTGESVGEDTWVANSLPYLIPRLHLMDRRGIVYDVEMLGRNLMRRPLFSHLNGQALPHVPLNPMTQVAEHKQHCAGYMGFGLVPPQTYGSKRFRWFHGLYFVL